MLILMHILSGIALILFGVRFLHRGLDQVFGPQLEKMLRRLGERPAWALVSGISMGVAVPSSTSIATLLRQPLESGLLTARQILPLALGADIGLTSLVLLAAMPIDDAAAILMVVGIIGYQFMSRKKIRGIGQALLSLGLVLLGATTIKSVGSVIANNPDVLAILQITQHYPVVLTLLACILAIVLQSSTAAIMLALSLGATGSINLSLALCVVIGANLGTGCTRLAIVWSVPEARRLGIAMLFAKIITALGLGVGFSFPLIASSIINIPLPVPLIIALVHTAFNAFTALGGLILRPLLLNLSCHLVPPAPMAQEKFGPRYINTGAIDSPALALGQSMREILRAADIVREMLHDVWQAMETNDQQLAEEVSQRDNQVDTLDQGVKEFLTRISSHELDVENAHEQMRQLRFMIETEAIGDIVDKNISELVQKKIRHQMQFSQEGWNDLQDFYKKVWENLLIAQVAFQTRDRTLAAQLLRHKEWLNNYHRQLADRHLARLTCGLRESHETSAVHLDLLANLKRINSCLSHVAYANLLDAHGIPAPSSEQSSALPPSAAAKLAIKHPIVTESN